MYLIDVWQHEDDPSTFVWDLKAGWNFVDYKTALLKFKSLIGKQSTLSNHTIKIVAYIADSGEPHRIIEMAWYGFKYFPLDYDTEIIVVGPQKRWQSLFSIYNHIHGTTKHHFTFLEHYDLSTQVM